MLQYDDLMFLKRKNPYQFEWLRRVKRMRIYLILHFPAHVSSLQLHQLVVIGLIIETSFVWNDAQKLIKITQMK